MRCLGIGHIITEKLQSPKRSFLERLARLHRVSETGLKRLRSLDLSLGREII